MNKRFRKAWRRHGATVLMVPILAGGFFSFAVSGVGALMLMTVPCSIHSVNTDKRLWRMRQAYIAMMGAVLCFAYDTSIVTMITKLL